MGGPTARATVTAEPHEQARVGENKLDLSRMFRLPMKSQASHERLMEPPPPRNISPNEQGQAGGRGRKRRCVCVTTNPRVFRLPGMLTSSSPGPGGVSRVFLFTVAHSTVSNSLFLIHCSLLDGTHRYPPPPRPLEGGLPSCLIERAVSLPRREGPTAMSADKAWAGSGRGEYGRKSARGRANSVTLEPLLAPRQRVGMVADKSGLSCGKKKGK